ncbi:MAG: polysaccharide biosynthesis protein [Dethiobacteria bacterium]|nr:polysaccharide biosynthesis protein [Bacillota bacterium]HOB28607.1 polysaccharide biosynthesis protein [Bacillota bacterium]HPZ40926.1 polysaccharide biosynthesis protein [Bacillota bacterium]HQD52017.1 polysaccharide biosynthesis protein [Bacillota bacterium]
MSSHSRFIRGAVILAVAGVAVRFIGAIMKIWLVRIIGDGGIGLYQMAYPIYSTLLAISTAGIPVAISKLVAENITVSDYRGAMRVFRIALLILTLTGLVISLLLFFTADTIVRIAKIDPRSVYAIMAIAPAIFFVTVMSALRGFFQGQQYMLPTAASQMIEQVGRAVVSLLLAVALLPRGLEYAAAGAAFGTVAGGFLGLLLLLPIYYRRRPAFMKQAQAQRRTDPQAAGQIIYRIFSLAIPITFGSLIMPLLSLIDQLIVPGRLKAIGLTQQRATALYGQLTGMAGSIVYFPNVVTLALSMSLVPAISEALVLRNKALVRNRTAVSIKLTALFSIPAAVGLYQLATPVIVLLFGLNNIEAGYALAYMSWSVIPLGLYVSTTGILQGLGKTLTPVVNMALGGVVKAILAWYLTAIPSLHIGGAALGSVIGTGLAAVLNLYAVARYTGWRFRIGELVLLPGLSVVAMAAAVSLSYRFLISLAGSLTPEMANGIATLGAIFIGIIIYGIALLFSGSLTRDEINLIPRIGPRLVELAERWRLLK